MCVGGCISPISKKYIFTTKNPNPIRCYTDANTVWPIHQTQNPKHSPNNITATIHAPNITNAHTHTQIPPPTAQPNSISVLDKWESDLTKQSYKLLFFNTRFILKGISLAQFCNCLLATFGFANYSIEVI